MREICLTRNQLKGRISLLGDGEGLDDVDEYTVSA